MKKTIALFLALSLALACAVALGESEIPAFMSKTVYDRIFIEADGIVVVPKENPEAVVIAQQLAALPEDKKMDVFPEEVKNVVTEAIVMIPEIENLTQIEPVDTYRLEIADPQPGAKIKIDAAYGNDVAVIGYIVEFLPKELALQPVFVIRGFEIEIPDGVTEIVVYAIAKK